MSLFQPSETLASLPWHCSFFGAHWSPLPPSRELRKVFHKLREKLSRQEKCELTDNLISSCVFLRFFCPAVLAPSLFNITTG